MILVASLVVASVLVITGSLVLHRWELSFFGFGALFSGSVCAGVAGQMDGWASLAMIGLAVAGCLLSLWALIDTEEESVLAPAPADTMAS